jgi:hypothetical protein
MYMSYLEARQLKHHGKNDHQPARKTPEIGTKGHII